MRSFSLFLLLCLTLSASEFEFKESRYYDALEFTRVSSGTIKYDKNTTTISYKMPIEQDIVISSSDVFILKDGDKKPVENRDALLFLRLFEKLIKDEDVDRYFKNKDGILIPKQATLKSTIKSIKKDSNTIDIELKNRDRIVFEKL